MIYREKWGNFLGFSGFGFYIRRESEERDEKGQRAWNCALGI